MGKNRSRLPRHDSLTARHYPAGSLAVLLTSWIGFRTSVHILLGTAAPLQAAKSIQGARVIPQLADVHRQLPTSVAITYVSAPSSQSRFPGVRQSAPTHIMSPKRQSGLAVNAAHDVPTPAPSAPISGASVPIPEPDPARYLPNAPQAPGLRISGWAIWRNDVDTAGLATAGQLGGSQAGIRAIIPVAAIRGLAKLGLNMRFSAPLRSAAGKEAALGLVLERSASLPIDIIVERRFGAREAMAVTAATGVSNHPLGNQMSMTGYGQAGLVGLRQRSVFVDGAVQIDRTLLAKNKIKVSGGLGVWGSAQPGVARLDIGPQATLIVSNIRISGQWRFRAMGDAQPGSGPAVVVGADF